MNKDLEESVKENTNKVLEAINEGFFYDLKERLTNPELLARADYKVQCAMNDLRPKRKTDCYFYEEVQDMAAHIPTCNYHGKLGYCKCEDCHKYISSKEVFRIVKEKVDNKNKH